MARHSPESFSTATENRLAPAPGQVPAAAAAARVGLAAGLVAGLLLGVLAMAAFAGPVRQAPDLAMLIHGMVLIKGLILAAAAAGVLWRLGRPTPAPLVLGYTGSLAVSAAALGWLWGLSWIPLGSALFYGGLIAAFVVAHNDRGFFDGVLPRRRG